MSSEATFLYRIDLKHWTSACLLQRKQSKNMSTNVCTAEDRLTQDEMESKHLPRDDLWHSNEEALLC